MPKHWSVIELQALREVQTLLMILAQLQLALVEQFSKQRGHCNYLLALWDVGKSCHTHIMLRQDCAVLAMNFCRQQHTYRRVCILQRLFKLCELCPHNRL